MASFSATPDAWDLAMRLQRGDRAALAQALTLVESSKVSHHAVAARLLEAVFPLCGAGRRLAITGPPGVGKSTLVDCIGCSMIAQRQKVAVLAIDPSSHHGGGILGDKTRMHELAQMEAAFIRPSASRGVLGGTSRATREAALLCEAAGYDRVIIETVGVGQSESTAADMADYYILVLPPDCGDELQAMKRGVLERADLILVNKADTQSAEETAAMLRATLRSTMNLRRAAPPVMAISAREKRGIDLVLDHLEAAFHAEGDDTERRREQKRLWVWELVDAALCDAARNHPMIREGMIRFDAAMARGKIAPSAAARMILSRLDFITEAGVEAEQSNRMNS